MISDLIKGSIDILLISETKVDNTFITSQFEIPGFSSPHHIDHSELSGGLLLYISEAIPSKQMTSNMFGEIECLEVEIYIY